MEKNKKSLQTNQKVLHHPSNNKTIPCELHSRPESVKFPLIDHKRNIVRIGTSVIYALSSKIGWSGASKAEF